MYLSKLDLEAPEAAPINTLDNARIELESGCVINLTASRVSAESTRQLRIFLPNRYYSLDYREQAIKGFRLEEGSSEQLLPGLGTRRILGDDLGVQKAEPLRNELDHFVRRCAGEAVAIVDGGQGRRALSTALDIAAAVGTGVAAGGSG